MAEHTPGPWIVSYEKTAESVRAPHLDAAHLNREEFGRVWGECGGQGFICMLNGGDFGYNDHPGAEANARLIAAAPELLESCKELLARCEQYLDPMIYGGEMTKARAAITKATGESQTNA